MGIFLISFVAIDYSLFQKVSPMYPITSAIAVWINLFTGSAATFTLYLYVSIRRRIMYGEWETKRIMVEYPIF
jgi:hypothetical protein